MKKRELIERGAVCFDKHFADVGLAIVTEGFFMVDWTFRWRSWRALESVGRIAWLSRIPESRPFQGARHRPRREIVRL